MLMPAHLSGPSLSLGLMCGCEVVTGGQGGHLGVGGGGVQVVGEAVHCPLSLLRPLLRLRHLRTGHPASHPANTQPVTRAATMQRHVLTLDHCWMSSWPLVQL